MTEEEIEKQARERAEKLEEKQTSNLYDSEEWNSGKVSGYEEGFIDGAKWGMEHAIEWHDLRKNPEDLPKNREEVLLYVNLHDKWEREVVLVGYIDYGECLGEYSQDWGYVEPIQNVKYDFVDGEEVIAWCELPQFKE